MRNQLKILLIDIELTYAIYYAFPSKKPQYMSAKQIKHHQFCVCAAWKWHHEVSTYVVKITDDKKQFKADFRNDKVIAVKLHQLMSEADVICAHNGDNFDIKHCNVMFKKHNLGPIPEKKTIDTLKVARRYFNFAGNDLDSLSRRFGGGGKNTKPCWYGLTDGNSAEINKAAKYCKNDVKELDVVLTELKPFIKNYPSMKNYGNITECVACGSKRVISKGLAFDGTKMYKRIKCAECGKEHKGRLCTTR